MGSRGERRQRMLLRFSVRNQEADRRPTRVSGNLTQNYGRPAGKTYVRLCLKDLNWLVSWQPAGPCPRDPLVDWTWLISRRQREAVEFLNERLESFGSAVLTNRTRKFVWDERTRARTQLATSFRVPIADDGHDTDGFGIGAFQAGRTPCAPPNRHAARREA